MAEIMVFELTNLHKVFCIITGDLNIYKKF